MALANISGILTKVLYVLPALLVGVVVHEYAHGRVAEMMGDPTARQAGRLTFNPLPHLDPFGSILLPLLLLISGSPVLFAAAKPVPVNPMYFKHGRRDFFWVGVAGPVSNLIIAAISGVILAMVYILAPGAIPVLRVLESLVTINCVLAIFNLIPLPPLDGSRLVEAYMPERWLKGYTSIEPFGIFIIFGLFFFVPGFFSAIIWPVVSSLANFFMTWPVALLSLIGL